MMPRRLFLSSLTSMGLVVMTCIVMTFVLTACVPSEPTISDNQKASYHYTLGVASLKEQNPTGALKEFLQAEKYDPRDPKIHAGLSQAYWIKRAYSLAEEHLKQAIKLSDEDPQYYNNIAALYLSMERYDDAIIAFQAAADDLLFDHPALAWTGIGLAYTQKRDYQSAQNAYLKAMDIDPRYYNAPFHLGELFYNQDRPVEALDMFTLSVKLAPNFANGYYWQGLVYMKMKEIGKAKQAFLEVMSLAPETEPARLAENYLKIINK